MPLVHQITPNPATTDPQQDASTAASLLITVEYRDLLAASLSPSRLGVASLLGRVPLVFNREGLRASAR